MLPSYTVLAHNILNLSPTTSANTGMTNLTAQIADFMNQVQAAGGEPGIFALAQSVVVAALAALPPVSDNSWINGFANAFEAGVTAAIITPGTVTNAAWIGSSGIDVNTLPSASTITTIAAAKAQLISDLANVTSSNNPPYPLAQAISDATLKFIFLCIGLGPPPTFVPIPLPLAAE